MGSVERSIGSEGILYCHNITMCVNASRRYTFHTAKVRPFLQTTKCYIYKEERERIARGWGREALRFRKGRRGYSGSADASIRVIRVISLCPTAGVKKSSPALVCSQGSCYLCSTKEITHEDDSPLRTKQLPYGLSCRCCLRTETTPGQRVRRQKTLP